MSDSWASSAASRAVMRANKGRDTRPERALRSAIHAEGMRYRVGIRPLKELRRTADVVFPKAKVAVFLDGCFWHGCPEHYRPSKGANADFWNNKVQENRHRDDNTNQLLKKAGWTVIRIWEHEDPQVAAHGIAQAIRSIHTSTHN